MNLTVVDEGLSFYWHLLDIKTSQYLFMTRWFQLKINRFTRLYEISITEFNFDEFQEMKDYNYHTILFYFVSCLSSVRKVYLWNNETWNTIFPALTTILSTHKNRYSASIYILSGDPERLTPTKPSFLFLRPSWTCNWVTYIHSQKRFKHKNTFPPVTCFLSGCWTQLFFWSTS